MRSLPNPKLHLGEGVFAKDPAGKMESLRRAMPKLWMLSIRVQVTKAPSGSTQLISGLQCGMGPPKTACACHCIRHPAVSWLLFSSAPSPPPHEHASSGDAFGMLATQARSRDRRLQEHLDCMQNTSPDCRKIRVINVGAVGLDGGGGHFVSSF
ncbi:hypothetical protein HII31_02720 [Pseudocercospora fuligena]|uniref:Uncharacterized protein n=1 Tax=Pseudocercospora fuligena TaxID=685502 RepID=A0A8H6VKM6_9PEZI|nr:hypothetical protein HII31_02720 [Pseudocercospora fuligena]